MEEITDYLVGIVSLITLIELWIIINLRNVCKRLNAENEMLARTLQIQTDVIEAITLRPGEK